MDLEEDVQDEPMEIEEPVQQPVEQPKVDVPLKPWQTGKKYDNSNPSVVIKSDCSDDIRTNLNEGLDQLEDNELVLIGAIYFENIIDCRYHSEENVETLSGTIQLDGTFCEIILQKENQNYAVVDSRAKGNSSNILSTQGIALQYSGKHELCAEVFESPRYSTLIGNVL